MCIALRGLRLRHILMYMPGGHDSSYIMKRSHDAVLKKLEIVSVADVCISVITKAELQYGVEVSPRRQQDQAALDSYLRYVEVMNFTDQVALDYAQIRAHLKVHAT